MSQLKTVVAFFCLFTIVIGNFTGASGQTVSDLNSYNESPSRFRGAIEKFSEDYGILNRFFSAQTSPNRSARLKQLNADWLLMLSKQNFDALNHDEQIDYLLFKNYLEHEQSELERRFKQTDEMSALLPFARTISDLEDSRRRLEPIDSAKIAALLNNLAKTINANQKTVEAELKDEKSPKLNDSALEVQRF